MVPDEAVTKALRELGFRFKKQYPRIMLWKKPGTTERIEVRRNSSHSDDYAAALLRKAGMSDEAIKSLIASVNN